MGTDDYRSAARHFWNRQIILDLVSVFVVSISVIAPQVYLAENPEINLNSTYFFEAVVIPIAFATGIFLGRKRRMLWFAFMGYIWSVTEDAPVYLDSVFTWPEVTSGFQHFFLEVLFHILTLFFMSLTIREAFKLERQRTKVAVANGSVSSDATSQKRKNGKILLILSLTFVAFISSYAQNIPLNSLETISGTAWYRLDIAEHIVSIAFLYVAVKVSLKHTIFPARRETD